MANTKVKIPEKHYVALQARSNSECPVGFLVPWGTDTAAQKRMNTADRWEYSNRWGHQKNIELEAKTINNDLMSGFKLAANALRHGTNTVSWRIVDPRGFELEINSENMANVVRLTTIENGEILSRCVWARKGANNVLLPEESEEYQDALKNTKRVKTKISIRDVNIGDKVLLHNGEKVVYLGNLFTLFQGWDDGIEGEGIQFLNKKRHYFYAETIDSNFKGGPSIKRVSSPKISSMIASSFMKIKDPVAFINEKVQAFEVQILTLNNNNNYQFIGVTNTLLDHSNLSVVLEEVVDINSIFKEISEKIDKNNIYINSVPFIAKLSDGTLIRVNSERYNLRYKPRSGKEFEGPVIYTDRLLNEARLVPKTNMITGGYNRSQSRKEFNDNEADWFWPKIVLTDPKTGNVIRLRMI